MESGDDEGDGGAEECCPSSAHASRARVFFIIK